MVNDKNHLYTKEDFQKDQKIIAKARTQQPFARFSATLPTALLLAGESATNPPTQIVTKTQIGDPVNDSFGTVGFLTQNIELDVYGSNYSILTINGDVDFFFTKIPQGRHIQFTIDFIVDTATPPTVNLDPNVINAPALPTLTNGLRVVMHFEGVVDDVGERFIYLGGTLSTGGGGSQTPWASDIDAASHDLFSLDRLSFAIDAGVPRSNDDPSIFLASTGDMVFNVATTDEFNWRVSNSTIAQLTQVGGNSDPVLQIRALDDATPLLRVTRIDSTPVVGAEIGRLEYYGVQTDGSTQEEFGRIYVDGEDLTNASIDGSMHFAPTLASSAVVFLSLNSSNDNKVRLYRNLIFNSLVDMELNGNDIYFDSGSNSRIFGTSTSISIEPNSSLAGVWTSSALTMQSGVSLANARSVQIEPSTSTFLIDGAIWYDSTANKFKARENGATVDLIGGGSSNSISQGDSNVTVTDAGTGIITLTTDGTQRVGVQFNRIDIEELPVFGITNITFHDSLAATSGIITTTSTNFDISVPTNTDTITTTVGGTNTTVFTEDYLRLLSGASNTAPAELQLFRDDASPTVNDVVGEIEFLGKDSGGTTEVYGKMGVEIDDVAAATNAGQFRWTVRHNNLDVQMMNLRDGILSVSRNQPTLAASGAALVLTRSDTGAAIGDEAGEISFNINDGSEKNYAVINAVWDNSSGGDDATRLDFKLLTDDSLQTPFILRGSAITSGKMSVEIGGEGFIKAQSGVLGFFVTSDPAITDSVGNSGTIQLPTINDGSPSLADLNAAFGAYDGACGYDENNGRFYIRKSSTVWSYYSESGTVT